MYSSIYCAFLVSKALQVLYFSKKSHCEVKLSSKRTNNQEKKLYCTIIIFMRQKAWGFTNVIPKTRKL